MRVKPALLAAAAALLLGAAPALAQSAADVEKAPPAAKVKAKAKAKAKGKNASEAIIINARAEALTSLTLTSEAGKPAASLKKPLPPGKKIALRITKPMGCSFSVAGTFADGTAFDPATVNLCTDKTIRLSDGPGEGAAEAPAPAEE